MNIFAYFEHIPNHCVKHMWLADVTSRSSLSRRSKQFKLLSILSATYSFQSCGVPSFVEKLVKTSEFSCFFKYVAVVIYYFPQKIMKKLIWVALLVIIAQFQSSGKLNRLPVESTDFRQTNFFFCCCLFVAFSRKKYVAKKLE